jgi:hypothetical protein
LRRYPFAAEHWQEPEDFRGLKFGASVEEMKAVFGNKVQSASVKPSNPRMNFFSERQNRHRSGRFYVWLS